MKKYYSLILTIIIFLAFCAACSTISNDTKEIQVTPTFIKLEDNLGGITGICQTKEMAETEQLIVFAAQYLGDPESEGIFIFDKNMETSVPIDGSGFFQISNLSPGLYVLLIGSNIDNVEAYQKNGVAIKIEVVSGEYTDIGVIN